MKPTSTARTQVNYSSIPKVSGQLGNPVHTQVYNPAPSRWKRKAGVARFLNQFSHFVSINLHSQTSCFSSYHLIVGTSFGGTIWLSNPSSKLSRSLRVLGGRIVHLCIGLPGCPNTFGIDEYSCTTPFGVPRSAPHQRCHKLARKVGKPAPPLS